jgi:hypothetical protein
MSKKIYHSLLCILFLSACTCTKETQRIFVSGLTCKYFVNPLSIDANQPRLSWKIMRTNARKNKGDFSLHCMMDEIGKLHPNNVKGILKFANDRNILLINSSPTSYNAADYKYTYILLKDSKNRTSVKRIVNKK